MTVTNPHSGWNCSVIGWGLPSDGRTLSGYSRSMVTTMQERGFLRREFSIKQLRPIDALTGALGLSFGPKGPRVSVRRSWIWTERASRALEKRLSRQLEKYGESGTFLQIGTIVEVDRQFGPYSTLCDMTIPQAYRAGQFAVARLSRRQYENAMAVQRRVFHNAAHAFTFTEWARRSIIEEYGVDPSRVTAVYTGPSVSIPLDLSIPKRPHQILFVGIDWERKGGPQLVEGFRELRRRLPSAELVVVGCSPKIDCDGVRVEGYLNPGDPVAQRRLGQLYQESSCLALMSSFEPLGIVIVEAFAKGLPVIVYDTGPQGEIVKDGDNGVVVLDREPKTIADGLYRLLNDASHSQAMGARAKKLVRTQLNWDCIVTKVAAQLSASTGRGTTKIPVPIAHNVGSFPRSAKTSSTGI
jgi:glycosyltransferase involved in cell wall biosynthesis